MARLRLVTKDPTTRQIRRGEIDEAWSRKTAEEMLDLMSDHGQRDGISSANALLILAVLPKLYMEMVGVSGRTALEWSEYLQTVARDLDEQIKKRMS